MRNRRKTPEPNLPEPDYEALYRDLRRRMEKLQKDLDRFGPEKSIVGLYYAKYALMADLYEVENPPKKRGWLSGADRKPFLE